MQQAIYNTVTINAATARPTDTPQPRRLARHLARRWDLYGVLALMASSAAYGVFALSHLA